MLTIYAAAHRDFSFVNNDWIRTIGTSGYVPPEGCLVNSVGKNIAHMGPYYNEITAQYWVRHNRPTPYVGFCHYRRWMSFERLQRGADTSAPEFVSPGHGILEFLTSPAQRERALALLQTYDVLAPRPRFFAEGMKAHYLENGLPLETWDVFIEAIAMLQPACYANVAHLEQAQHASMRNMFVTDWQTFCDYNDALIPLLDYMFAKVGDKYKDHPNDSRFCGYLSETFFNLWTFTTRRRMLHLPMVMLQD